MKQFPITVLFFLLLGSFSFAQDMQKGFTYLETGQYANAEVFFKEVLASFPKNKTARLCYGRAIGLNGKSKEAVELFTGLLADHPNDFEVKLNYAESLLWALNYTAAETYYQNLLQENNQSFPALLGYANTLSNLKKYPEALVYVTKALDVSPGNPNALTSKKYIYLGYAYQEQQQQHYSEAERLLLENLALFKNDTDILKNLANLYLIMGAFAKAQETYTILQENPVAYFSAQNGLALVAHLEGKEKLALQLSTTAYQKLSETQDKTTIQQTKERYIQALIWNKKFTPARTEINNLLQEDANANWVLALRATLHVYTSDFNTSLNDYNAILKRDTVSFDGNLGKANTLKALGRTKEAYTSAENTLKFYKNQKDAIQFIKDLDKSFTPFTDTRYAFSFDNGNNEANTFKTAFTFPLSLKFKALGSYEYRTTKNTITLNEATSQTTMAGISYELAPNVFANGSFGLTKASATRNSFTQSLIDISLQTKPFKLQVLDVGYKKEVQNFNADLLERQLVQHNFYANYNLSTNFNLGWFTQYYYTTQNDDNTRNLLFTSLYYNILPKPALKAGINYQYITFKNQVPTIYFSPEKFNAVEVFVNVIKDEGIARSKEWFYELTAATGLQYIEDNAQQSTYRIQAKLGYVFSERCRVNLFGTQSNIASTTAAGFTFTEFGVRLHWYLTKAPIFQKK